MEQKSDDDINKMCEWELSNDFSLPHDIEHYLTNCGYVFREIDFSVVNNFKFTFCPYCSNQIKYFIRDKNDRRIYY